MARSAGRRLVAVLLAVLLLALVLLAARADSRAAGASPLTIAADLAVGAAFVVGAWLATGRALPRWLLGAVGGAWLTASWLEGTQSWHQGLLLLAMLVLLTGPVLTRAVLAVAAIPLAAGLVPQLGVAGLMAALSVVALARTRRPSAIDVFVAGSGAALAVVLSFAWYAVRLPSPSSPLLLYQTVLLAVALAVVPATRAHSRARSHLADRVLDDERSTGLDGLRAVLADVLGDPRLRVEHGEGSGGLQVRDGEEVLARVVTVSPAVQDPQVASAVVTTVRLALLKLRLHDRQVQRLAELQASRRRLLDAADRERRRFSADLEGAVTGLAAARAALSQALVADDPDVRAVAELAAREVGSAALEVERIVDGVAPADLGHGRLERALEALAGRNATPAVVRVRPSAEGDTATETAAYYVCSEALANVDKHARASSVHIEVDALAGGLQLTISDDGRGGADAAGSGLQGLGDRVAALGGSLRVESAPGAGTTVTAILPAQGT